MVVAQAIRHRNSVTDSGGTQPAIIFAHGFGCDQSIWRLLTPELAVDYRIVSYDHVGSGRAGVQTYSAARYVDLAGYAEDLVQLVEILDAGPVILVGHSVGAMIGLLAANARPELFRRLVMIGPSPRYQNDAPDYVGGFEREALEDLLDLLGRNVAGWAGVMAPVVMDNPDRPELAAELEDRFCRMDPDVARQFARATFLSDYRHALPEVRVPALIVQMRKDAVAPVCVGEYMHARMPRSTLRVMEVAGHCPHLSHPLETAAVIREFLRTE
jgi:sigma-B regulation protein RsbQ